MLLHMKMHSGIDANVSTRTSPNSEVAVSLPYCPVKQLNKEFKVKVVPLLWATNSKIKTCCTEALIRTKYEKKWYQLTWKDPAEQCKHLAQREIVFWWLLLPRWTFYLASWQNHLVSAISAVKLSQLSQASQVLSRHNMIHQMYQRTLNQKVLPWPTTGDCSKKAMEMCCLYSQTQC